MGTEIHLGDSIAVFMEEVMQQTGTCSSSSIQLPFFCKLVTFIGYANRMLQTIGEVVVGNGLHMQ